MTVFVVFRFDPMQCGACGVGHVDRIFSEKEDADAYVAHRGSRRGVSWQIREFPIEETVAA